MKKAILLGAGIGIFWSAIFFAAIYPNERQVTISEDFPRIILQTQPVDPRDLLRGDFVILSYPFAQTWSNDSVTADIVKENHQGTKVYVSFAAGKDGRATATKASLIKPESGIFLTGEIYGRKTWNKELRFGIEKFFVPAGKGWELEKERNRRNLEAVIAVDPKSGKGLVVDLLVGKTSIDFEDIEPDMRSW